MRIEQDLKLDFKDVLIRPKRSTLSSRSEVSLERTYKSKHAGRNWTGIPVIAANMDHTGTLAMAAALAKHDLLTAVNKFASLEEWQAQSQAVLKHSFLTIGSSAEERENAKMILAHCDLQFICIDVANGYTQSFVDCVRETRRLFPDKIIMAGNVVTGEMTEELLISGADIVKVGIGPGSVCTTRKKTGVGYPQLSAIIECADAAHGLKGLVCADGGCTSPGDVAKAFAAGADFVMLGGMFAGHEQCAGDLITVNNKQYKRFYGMGSAEAMQKYHGKIADYRSAEGKSVNVPYRGDVYQTVLDILGGLRSACTYVGATHLKELSKRTTFVRVTQQLNEVFSMHDVNPNNKE